MAQRTQLFNISIERRNARRAVWSDLYHFLIDRSWRHLLGLIALVYVTSNALFAGLYLLGADSVAGAHSFGDYFFFSVQTMSTIGYGTMAPHTTWANLLVTVQAFAGTLFIAVVTGLIFSKFARPTARVMWSRHIVFIERDGGRQLMFRMANERNNQIVDAQLRLVLARDHISSDGELMRRFYDVPLMRDRSLLFQLSWTAIHHINDDSPLAGMTPDEMRAESMQLICSLTGIDETSAQQVHSRHAYRPDDFVWDQRFADIIGHTEDGGRFIDYAHFDRLVPMGTRSEMAAATNAKPVPTAANAKPTTTAAPAPDTRKVGT
jgi:inward rectifier potassium channel